MASNWKLEKVFASPGGLASAEIKATMDADPEIYDRLSAKDLQAVVRLLDAHWHKARAFEAGQILAEGAIWDPQARALRELEEPETARGRSESLKVESA